MKIQFFWTIALPLMVLFSCCNRSQSGEVTIKGQFVENIPEMLRYTVPVNGTVFEGFYEEVTLDSLGGFEIHLELERPALISFRYYDSPSLIVEPGKHYDIILNLNKDRKLSIEGDLGNVQKFFNELPHENPLTCLYSFGDEISNYNEINKRLKSELAKEELAIQQLYSDGKTTENLKDLLITERKFYYKAAQGVLAGTNRLAFLGNNEPIPDDLHHIWQEALDFEKIDSNYFLQSYFAWSLIEQKIWQNVYTKFDVEQFTKIRAEKRKANLTHSHNVELAKEFFSGDILEYYLAGLFYHQMMRREIDVNLQAIFEQFKTDYPQSAFTPFLEPLMQEIADFVEKGD